MAKKPLHNFDLPNPNLEWKIEGSSIKNRRKVRSPSHHTTPYPPPIHHPEPIPEVMLEEEEELEGMDITLTEYLNNVAKIRKVDKERAEKKSEERVRGEGGDEVNRSGLVIKLRWCKNVESVKGKGVVKSVGKNKDGKKKDVEKKGTMVMVDAKEEDVQGKGKDKVKMKGDKEKANGSFDGVEEEVKSWNLRSRTNKSRLNSNIGDSNGSTPMLTGKGKTQPPNSKEVDIWGNLNINTTLTPREIEEDFYAMGVKLTRKVQKRPKSEQNIIDKISPGNNLKNITADRYDVDANSMKK